MPNKKAYNGFYETGSTARKKELEVEYDKNETVSRNRRYGKNKLASNKKTKAHKNVSVVLGIVSIFAMTMVITYRYNIISEKNLESQNLKSELAATEANLLNAQIELEQKTDLNKIEAYAKQQLGMQKPDKNQTIYVDTSKSIKTVEQSQDTTVVDNIINAIKNFFNSIF